MSKKIRLTFSKIGFRFWIYIISAFAIVLLIEGVQYYRHNMFGTDLLLGWDTPSYVWTAKQIVLRSPLRAISIWSYPHLYTQTVAFFGYLTKDFIMVERILPLFFFLLLIYMNSRMVQRITNDVHLSGLTALLTATSINALRLLADLHRNLMAFSLSFVALYLISRLEEKSTWNKKFFLLLLLLFSVIASTQFETYIVLSASLMLYGVFTRNSKKLLTLVLVCGIPVVILALLSPLYFFGYMNTVFFTGQRELTFNEVFRWAGGSWILLSCLVVAIYSFFKSELRKNKLAQLIFSWFFVIALIVASIRLKLMPLPNDFATRAMLVFPLPVLIALATSTCINFAKDLRLRSKGSHVYRRLVNLIPICLIVVSVVVACQNFDEFLNPYLSRTRYEKIMITKRLLIEKGLSVPVFAFYGYPAFWYFVLDRSYIGMEMGEHFAYYGTIENLLRLAPSEPYSSDPYISEMERQWGAIYFNELTGRSTWPPPPHNIHESYIRSVEDLMSHPIAIIAPEFYNDRILYFLKPFYVSDGIYVIPPNSSINTSEIAYGPEVTVIKNGILTQVKSEYGYIDPYDPSIVYIKVNASSGHTSYNFTDFPLNWAFHRVEQGGDPSFPEMDPRRINGTKAYNGNDPADSLDHWTIPVHEQNGTLQIDISSKKEGFASLMVSGKTDSWGNLGVRYDGPGTWSLVGYSSINVWARYSESATFSITLVDCYGGSRTFWGIEAKGSSATTSWKRFVVNLTEYDSQTLDFRINLVDHIDLSVYSSVEKNLSFWVDDLTVDTPPNLNAYVYKDRVPTNEILIIYFYSRVETSQTP